MAKVSMIARENKRIKMVQKFAKKREELKKVISDMNLSDEERYEARLKLQKLSIENFYLTHIFITKKICF